MARAMTDVLLDDSNDLQMDATGNDLVLGESTQQHQKLLLLCDKLSFKESPTMCVGVMNYLDDENMSELTRAISVEFSRDGMQVQSVRIEGGQIKANANYV